MSRQPRPSRSVLRAAGVMVLAAALLPAMAYAAEDDPREGLAPGYLPWSEASSNIELLDNDPRVAPFDAPPGNFGFVNSDLAFTGDTAVVGNFNGFQFYDISDPTDPTLSGSFVCPGGQGDVSVYGDLLFMSVEETRGRIDCGSQGAAGAVNPERFRGVRIFDISDQSNPVQLPGVQTCRGSHTHTIVSDPDDPANIYIYNSGTSGVRPAARAGGLRERDPHAEPGHLRQPDAVAHRRHQGAARRARRPPPSSASRGSSPTRSPRPTTACRTRCPVRSSRWDACTRRVRSTRRRPTPTPATT